MSFSLKRLSQLLNAESNWTFQNTYQGSFWHTTVVLSKHIGPTTDTLMGTMRQYIDSCRRREESHKISYVAVHRSSLLRCSMSQPYFIVRDLAWIIPIQSEMDDTTCIWICTKWGRNQSLSNTQRWYSNSYIMHEIESILSAYSFDHFHCTTFQFPLQNWSGTASMYPYTLLKDIHPIFRHKKTPCLFHGTVLLQWTAGGHFPNICTQCLHIHPTCKPCPSHRYNEKAYIFPSLSLYSLSSLLNCI